MSVPNKRMIHSRIWISKQFTQLKPLERYLYIGMISFGDYHGLLRGDVTFLRREFFYNDRIGKRKIEKMRDQIAEVGLIEFYSDKNGEYISHPNWNKYQRLDTRSAKPSEYPDPPSWKERGITAGSLVESSVTEPNSTELSEKKRKEKESNEIKQSMGRKSFSFQTTE